MKLTLGLFCLSIHFAFALNTYAQSTSITLDVVACPIAEVLDIIEKETEFQFFYNSKVVNVKETVSVKAKSENVITVLDRIFDNSEIQYRIIDKDIILTVAERTAKTQQTKSVRGG
ncbi:MAG: STN domain-containing protein [Tannerellaceae bacterium]|nr:STN domain-containing protein [Tannerellaceae bacterium]